MPYSFDLLDEEQKKKADQEDGQGPAPAMTGGGESFGAGSPQVQSLTSEKGTNQQGSGFVNLDKYMSANQGNQFGNQFTGKVQGDVTAAKDTLDKSANDFTDASNQGTTRWNDVKDPLNSIVGGAGDNTSADDVSKVKGWSNAQYQGPESFSGSQWGTQAQGATQKASQEAGALQTEGGRFALLDQFYGRPKYSMGEKTLDNAIVSSTPGVAARAQNLNNQGQQARANLGQETQDLNNTVTANKGATQEAAQNSRDAVSGARTGFDTDLQGRFKSYNDANDAYNHNLRSDIGDDELSADTLAAYGLKSGDNLYGVNLGNYLHDSPQANLGQFASDQDYAKYLALSQLAGDDPTELAAENRAQAGTADGMGRSSVDTGGLTRDIAAQKSAFEGNIAPLNQAVSQAQAAMPGLKQAADAAMNKASSLAASGVTGNSSRAPAGYDEAQKAADAAWAAYQAQVNKLQQAQAAIAQANSSYRTGRTVK